MRGKARLYMSELSGKGEEVGLCMGLPPYGNVSRATVATVNNALKQRGLSKRRR